MTDMLASCKALLEIEADGRAVPPIPRTAVDCLEWAVYEIERLRAKFVTPDGFTQGWNEGVENAAQVIDAHFASRVRALKI